MLRPYMYLGKYEMQTSTFEIGIMISLLVGFQPTLAISRGWDTPGGLTAKRGSLNCGLWYNGVESVDLYVEVVDGDW